MTRILDQFLRYETRVSAGSKLREIRFAKFRRWYASENYIGKIITRPMLSRNASSYRIHGLPRTEVLGLIKNHIMSRKNHELFPSSADAINIKRSGLRLRAFYITNPSHRHTFKIVHDIGQNFWSSMGDVRKPEDDRYETIKVLKREVAIRENLLSLKTINIPRIYCTDVQDGAFLVSEEMVMGRRFNAGTDMELYRAKVLPQLRDTYLARGVRYEPIEEFLPFDLSGKVARILENRVDSKSFEAALKNVIERNGLAAVSLCHGGLRPNHLAVLDGEVFFLDWKRAHEGLIIIDLLKIPLMLLKKPLIYRKLTSMIENIREIMTPKLIGNGYSFEDMLTVAIARAILNASSPHRISNLLRVWRRYALSRPG